MRVPTLVAEPRRGPADAGRRGSTASTSWRRSSTRARRSASPGPAPPRRAAAEPAGGDGVIGLLRKHRFFRSHPLRASYDAIVIGGGAHGMATAYYLAKDHGMKNVAVIEQSYIGAGRVGAQHDHHPLELPHAGGHALLHREREAVRDALAGPELQHAVLAARPPDPGPLRPLGEHDDGAGRGEPAARRRLAGDLPGRDQGARADARRLRPPDVPDPGGALPPARRHHPPRRGGVGLRQGGRPARRRDPPLHRGDRHHPPERARHRHRDEPRARSRRER